MTTIITQKYNCRKFPLLTILQNCTNIVIFFLCIVYRKNLLKIESAKQSFKLESRDMKVDMGF